jgi:hypothetical protein
MAQSQCGLPNFFGHLMSKKMRRIRAKISLVNIIPEYVMKLFDVYFIFWRGCEASFISKTNTERQVSDFTSRANSKKALFTQSDS